jgi:hypothetical protein
MIGPERRKRATYKCALGPWLTQPFLMEADEIGRQNLAAVLDPESSVAPRSNLDQLRFSVRERGLARRNDPDHKTALPQGDSSFGVSSILIL